MTNFERLARVIAAVARNEDRELSAFGKGILYVPELAFAYLAAKAIVSRKSEIFDTSTVDWLPETGLGGPGRSDLVFRPAAGRAVVVEFKMNRGREDYVADLRKLQSLGTSYDRLFCGVLGASSDGIDTDPRIVAVEHVPDIPVRRVYAFESFETKQPSLVQSVCCVVGVWQITGVTR